MKEGIQTLKDVAKKKTKKLAVTNAIDKVRLIIKATMPIMSKMMINQIMKMIQEINIRIKIVDFTETKIRIKLMKTDSKIEMLETLVTEMMTMIRVRDTRPKEMIWTKTTETTEDTKIASM